MQRRMKPMNKTRRKCSSRKIRFDSEHDALKGIKHGDSMGKTERPTRAYYCQECHGFHLTKAPYSREIPVQHCDELAVLGTGVGACDRPIDPITGLCDRPSDHLAES